MCKFCERFDFSSVRAVVDKHGARIDSAICNTKFPVCEQFKFCPECGRPLYMRDERKEKE